MNGKVKFQIIGLLLAVAFHVPAQSKPEASGSSSEETARQALASGRFTDAEARYRALLRSDPESPSSLLGLGLALHLEGKSSEAIPVLTKANRLHETPAALATLALDYCRLGSYDQANPILRRVAQSTSDPNVLAAMGSCYLDSGQAVEAVSIYQSLVDRKIIPQDENAASLARAYLKASRYFGTLLKKSPGGDEYAAIIQNAARQGSADARAGFEKATAAYSYLKPSLTFPEAVALLHDHSQNPALLYMLTVLSGEKAMEAITEMQSRYPNSISYRCLHAEILANQGRDELARREYEELANSPDATVTVYHDIAMYYRKVKDWSSALRYFQREQALAPDDERAAVGISDSLLNLNDFAALRNFLLPVVAKGNCFWAALDLSRAEQELGNLKEAIRVLEKAEACDPSNSVVHYRLSRLFHQTGNMTDADRQLKLFVKLRGNAAMDPLSDKK